MIGLGDLRKPLHLCLDCAKRLYRLMDDYFEQTGLDKE